jgi:outer membrane receptor for ferrienterochelin and colicin
MIPIHQHSGQREAVSVLLASLLFGLATPCAAIDAIDAPLEELLKINIVSAPKFAENPDQIPSHISVLTAEDIRQYGWRTLSDALRTLQGSMSPTTTLTVMPVFAASLSLVTTALVCRS